MNEELRFHINLTWDGPEDATSWGYALADCLFVSGAEIPDSWQYKPGVGEVDSDGEGLHHYLTEWEPGYEHEIVASMLDSGTLRPEEAIHAGNVLTRYIRTFDTDDDE